MCNEKKQLYLTGVEILAIMGDISLNSIDIKDGEGCTMNNKRNTFMPCKDAQGHETDGIIANVS